MQKNLKGTWPQAVLTFFGPFLLILGIRWGLVEPFVVPSGSMIPSLQVHDHILASKISFGLHLPFSLRWLVKWSHPQKGDIAVFRYPKTPEVFYVKRILGLPGDELRIEAGELYINNIKQPQTALPELNQDGFNYFRENNYVIRYNNKEDANFSTVKIPEGMYFALGDNRDQSADSRYWGFIPEANFVGRVKMVWLSCDENLASKPFLCLKSIHWNRLLLAVK